MDDGRGVMAEGRGMMEEGEGWLAVHGSLQSKAVVPSE